MYKIAHLKAAILLVIGGLLVARGYQNRSWMFDLIESRKPYDSELIASIGGLVAAPKISNYSQQLNAINDASVQTQRSTRVGIGSKVGVFEISNKSVVSEAIVPAAVTAYGLDYWAKTGDPELLASGRTWEQDGKNWHMIVRLFTLGPSGKFMFVSLITNLDHSIASPWTDNVIGLILLGFCIICVVTTGGVLLAVPANSIAKSIANSQAVEPRWWWAIEFRVLGDRFNTFALAEDQAKIALKESNQSLEDMYRRLRHDIITACGGVRNMLAEMDSAGFEPAEQYRDFYELARAKADVAYELVSTTGKLGQPLDIKLEDVTSLFSTLKINYAENNVRFRAVEGTVLIPVDLNTFCLRVLGNLIGNAIKYSSPPSEDVEVGVKKSKEGDTVIYVRDNGCGLSPPEIEKILSNHGQSARLQPEIPGSGTGLHTAAQVIRQHGFSLGVKSKKSEVGGGSIFYVTIPKDKARWS